MNQIIQQIRDVLDTLLPVQEITIKLNETQMQLLPAERQELARFVDEAVSNLLAIDCLLTDRRQKKECRISAAPRQKKTTPIFQKELCDLAEARRKLRSARGMYHLLTTKPLPPETEKLKGKRARLLEEIRILEFVCGEPSSTGRAENSFCMNCGCEIYCQNCDPNPPSQ